MRVTKIILGIIVICCLLNSGALSNNTLILKRDTLHCLVIGGSLPCLTEKIKNIHIYLYLESDKIDSVVIDSSSDFSFPLLRNKKYCIQIIASGYIGRYITIDTTLPKEVKSYPQFGFEFTMELKKAMTGVDDYYLDFPIAHINYNPKTDKFDYSHKYTAFMQSKLKKTESEFRFKKSHH